MLFAVKRHLLASLILTGLLVLAALSLRYLLDLQWRFTLYPYFFRDLLGAVFVVAASDILLHGVLTLTLRQVYLLRYRELVEYFRPQGVPEIIGGGILAGAEETIFRGVLLEALLSKAQWPAAAAMIFTGVVFGLLHVLPSRRLLPLTIWTIWEGVLLSWVYVLTGSLLLSIVLHVLHDLGGFGLFAYQRKTGWLLGATE